MTAKRYHLKGSVWLVREGGYMPDYAVMVGDKKVADVYFFRQVTKHGASVTSRLTFVETGVRVTDIASYFDDLKQFLRRWDWSRPAPPSVEEFRMVLAGYRERFPCHSEPTRSEAMQYAKRSAEYVTQQTGQKHSFRWYGDGYEVFALEPVS